MAGWDVHTHLIPPTVLSAAHKGEFGLSVDNIPFDSFMSKTSDRLGSALTRSA